MTAEAMIVQGSAVFGGSNLLNSGLFIFHEAK
jgi:hypothetical protein